MFAVFVMVVMLNLLIAIMGEAYDKVQSRMQVEGLREQAKMIVDEEDVYPDAHWYPGCLHIKTAAEAEDQALSEQLGITGRMKQDNERLQAAVAEKFDRADKTVQEALGLTNKKIEETNKTVQETNMKIEETNMKIQTEIQSLDTKFERMQELQEKILDQLAVVGHASTTTASE